MIEKSLKKNDIRSPGKHGISKNIKEDSRFKLRETSLYECRHKIKNVQL